MIKYTKKYNRRLSEAVEYAPDTSSFVREPEDYIEHAQAIAEAYYEVCKAAVMHPTPLKRIYHSFGILSGYKFEAGDLYIAVQTDAYKTRNPAIIITGYDLSEHPYGDVIHARITKRFLDSMTPEEMAKMAMDKYPVDVSAFL